MQCIKLSFFVGDKTGQRVKVAVADFTKEDVFGEIEGQLQDLNVGVLGWTFFSVLPSNV